jgi:exopolysaccharide production protein ExoY
MYRIGTFDGARLPRLAGGQRGRPVLDAARLFDILAAAALIAFLAPVMILVALGVKAQDGGPVAFGQLRIGRDGRPFRCLKFRSMVVDAEDRLGGLLASDAQAREEWAVYRKLRRDPRITPLGAFLRKSSLDELPQLFNVLRGEMSLVGPRPIVPSEAPLYGRWLRHYKAVRPGITGLWQVSGRNHTSYRRRVALDVLYARRRGFALDLMILLKTVPAVLLTEGSY